MTRTPWKQILRVLKTRQPAMVRRLRTLVEIESPTTDPEAVARLARVLSVEWKKRGASVRLLPQKDAGPILRAEVAPAARKPKDQILILGHLDTVYPLGHLKGHPFRVASGRAYGPGSYDMKAGLVQALFAVEALNSHGFVPEGRLVFLFTSDEETGSRAGRPVLEREARKSRAVLVLEPSQGRKGALKTARKGGGDFEIIVHGRAAHSGIEPEKGVNAVHELAAQLVRIRSWARPSRGLTLNANLIEGGTRTNVVAEQARAVIDVRVPRLADGAEIEKRIRSLRPFDTRARIEVRGSISRPPLERTAGVGCLFQHAQMLGREMGFRLEEASTGGGSDGNFTGALGVPTLDGLGAVGAGAHTPNEYVVVKYMPERAALLAALLSTL